MKGTNKLVLSHVGMEEVVQKWIGDTMYRADVVVSSVSYDGNSHTFVIELKEKPAEEKK